MKKYLVITILIIATASLLFVTMHNITKEVEAVDIAISLDNESYVDAESNVYAVASEEPVDYWRVLPEYIPSQQTYQEKWAALIDYALNRYNNAQVEGNNIQLGRHTAANMQLFRNAIQTSQDLLMETKESLTNAQAQENMEILHSAIANFRNTIIDPNNRYRPFLETIAHGEDIPQKHHLRAAWIATVLNIDWPSVDARGTTPAHVDLQKHELYSRFNEIADLGFNSVIFQISPTGDAFFRSEISPWSAWLTGETNFTGVLIDSQGIEFDPLEYAIELARA
ncbi:MAG: family 10 glycosylhydrolase, partial [Defluviitaleaceae bacterium]|nr:family 10 glycosylhydrolase [Defluviitaleaceae bacterium]